MNEPQGHSLSTSIDVVKGVGPKVSKLLSKKGIRTLEDALYFLPRTYQDRSAIRSIASCRIGDKPTLIGTVSSCRYIGVGRKKRFEATLSDKTGSLSLLWFNAYPSLEKEFKIGNQYLVYGEVSFFGKRKQIVHPECEKLQLDEQGRPRRSLNFGGIIPVYSETEGLHQKTIRRLMREALYRSLDQVEESLPKELEERLGFPSLKNSFTSVHFPKNLPEKGQLSDALRRIIFEEFFVLQIGLLMQQEKKRALKGFEFSKSEKSFEKLQGQLPFNLTGDQNKTLKEIEKDFSVAHPMARLIQGDVGSGKTVVAFAAALAAIENDYQVALMAPTEILAIQHLKGAEKWLAPLGISIGLLSQGHEDKDQVLKDTKNGTLQLVIGTHALIQQKANFKNLALVIIDEQHRFGVEQRSELLKKATDRVPHLLMMSATPIPRTLGLTLYGDLDLSLIKQKPADRKPIKTSLLRSKDRPALYQQIRRTVEQGQQVYIIYPLVENSDKLELKSATEMYEKLRREVFSDLKLALLHGRLSSEEKDQVLKDFSEGKYQILVSTTVIEVGIDVANATLMVIEHPERLGLSQLHQLRGRVGRSALESQCLLVAEHGNTRRLKVMVDTNDGFEIAEADLEIRGPGEFLGTQQSGLPGFRVAHLLRDASLLEVARREAKRILERDPKLELSAHSELKNLVKSRWSRRFDRLRSG